MGVNERGDREILVWGQIEVGIITVGFCAKAIINSTERPVNGWQSATFRARFEELDDCGGVRSAGGVMIGWGYEVMEVVYEATAAEFVGNNRKIINFFFITNVTWPIRVKKN